MASSGGERCNHRGGARERSVCRSRAPPGTLEPRGAAPRTGRPPPRLLVCVRSDVRCESTCSLSLLARAPTAIFEPGGHGARTLGAERVPLVDLMIAHISGSSTGHSVSLTCCASVLCVRARGARRRRERFCGRCGPNGSGSSGASAAARVRAVAQSLDGMARLATTAGGDSSALLAAASAPQAAGAAGWRSRAFCGCLFSLMFI